MDKYALVRYDRGNTYPNPFLDLRLGKFSTRTTLVARVGGVTATVGRQPRFWSMSPEKKEVELGEGTITFTTADLKGLVTDLTTAPEVSSTVHATTTKRMMCRTFLPRHFISW